MGDMAVWEQPVLARKLQEVQSRGPDRAALGHCESCLQAGALQLFCRFPPFTAKRLKCARFFVIGGAAGCAGIDLSVRSIAHGL